MGVGRDKSVLGSCLAPDGHMESICCPSAQCLFAWGEGLKWLEKPGLQQEETDADVPDVEGSQALGSKTVETGRVGRSSPPWQQGPSKPTSSCVEKQAGGHWIQS